MNRNKRIFLTITSVKAKKALVLAFTAMVLIPLVATAVINNPTPITGTVAANTRAAIGTAGVPAKVAVTLTPPKTFADKSWHYYVIKVELQDLYGNPAYAPDGGTGVSLLSSNPAVGNVYDRSLTISAGNTYAVTHFGSTYTAGTTKIEASAPGLMSGSATMTTWGRNPTKLQLFLAPNKVLSDDQYYNYPVIVQLQDAAGNPAPAPPGGLIVSLSSSVPTVGYVPTYLTISEGKTYGVTWFHSKLIAGTTTITAAAAGLTASTATMTTVAPGAASASKLALWLAPIKLPATSDTESYTVVVQLQDTSDRPVKPSATTTVSFYWTDPAVGTVSPSSVSISSPSSHAYASFVSTYKPSSTDIQARSTGLTNSPWRTMYTDGNTPQKFAVYLGPSKVFAHKRTYSYLVWVQLQDNAGNPARALTGGKTVTLTSLTPSVGTLSSTSMTISAGSDSSYVSFISTYVPGSTTITAADGLTTGSATMKTVAPKPYKLGLNLAPSKVFADNSYYYRVVRVLLQDASGNPAMAPVGGISVSFSSGDLTIGSVEASATIPEGGFFATAWFKSTGVPGTTTITATASIGGVTKTATAPMTTVSPTANPPAKVAVVPLPKYPSVSGTYYDSLIVYLLDATGNPTDAPTGGISISLSSTDTLVGQVDNGVTIGGGSMYTYTWFRSTWSPGTTTINPAAAGSTLTPIPAQATTGTFTGSPKTYNFGSIPILFYTNTFLVVGNAAAANEAMSAAVFGPALTAAGTLSPITKTDTLLTLTEKTSKNLIAFGYNNNIRTSYPLGIVVSESTTWFNITARTEGKSINFTKSSYPSQSVAIVYLAKNGTRAIMFMWGYGWQGTYAAALFMSDTAKWQTYATKHLLFLQWTDANTNGFIEKTEITVATSA